MYFLLPFALANGIVQTENSALAINAFVAKAEFSVLFFNPSAKADGNEHLNLIRFLTHYL